MNLEALSNFNLVALHGGFGKASRASGRSKATLSRQVMELEESLGVRLLERGSHSLRLTEEGAALFRRTAGPLSEITEIGREVGAGIARPSGLLRISAPLLFSHVALGRLAADYRHAFPDVRLEITAEDRFVDLVEDGYDLVIRINPRPSSDLVGRCFLRDQMLVVGSPTLARPALVAAVGTATRVPAAVLTTMAEGSVWQMADELEGLTLIPDPVLRLSSILMVRDAVRAGAGAGLLPLSMIADDLAAGVLVSWGRVSHRGVEAWILHASRRLASSKVTSFIQFLCDAFPNGGWPDGDRRT
ncbi:LysR family transcriptional regulator [Labrys miyagiensis]|uniref:LysR family transcriptional regulator n=1 Tax=Labrys miyagiensis TaxID=346912 RepID=A0ABQ6CYH0_9HYPH|nr:LysR family transcriptional regulator [Labrys miyagiensis]GLS23322.1 LysR family transcriptional regulator [Labrys miyagiensis]